MITSNWIFLKERQNSREILILLLRCICNLYCDRREHRCYRWDGTIKHAPSPLKSCREEGGVASVSMRSRLSKAGPAAYPTSLSAAAGAGHRGSVPTRQQVGAAAACAMCISCLLPIRRSAGETCAISTALEFGHHSANTIYCILHTWSKLVCNNNAALCPFEVVSGRENAPVLLSVQSVS
jgi:hypothetical protein